jgi:hypothetical protein
VKKSGVLVALALCASATMSQAQTPAAGQAPLTDVYNVLFAKAAPGQAAALAKQLQTPDPKDPMGSHFLLLRHQEGADWDYCLISHVGAKGSVAITPPTAELATMAWHDDTFVGGPSWPEFQKVMGMTGDQSTNRVYLVGVHRAAPGHREKLAEALNAAAAPSNVPVNGIMLRHLEGGPWHFLTLQRYDSWQAFGAERTANPAGGQGWLDARQHSASHTDTIADRVR